MWELKIEEPLNIIFEEYNMKNLNFLEMVRDIRTGLHQSPPQNVFTLTYAPARAAAPTARSLFHLARSILDR